MHARQNVYNVTTIYTVEQADALCGLLTGYQRLLNQNAGYTASNKRSFREEPLKQSCYHEEFTLDAAILSLSNYRVVIGR